MACEKEKLTKNVRIFRVFFIHPLVQERGKGHKSIYKIRCVAGISVIFSTCFHDPKFWPSGRSPIKEAKILQEKYFVP